MITNQQQNLRSSLYNAILKWQSDNVEEIADALDSYWGEYITELMADAAFNIMLAQKDVIDWVNKEGIDFSE